MLPHFRGILDVPESPVAHATEALVIKTFLLFAAAKAMPGGAVALPDRGSFRL